MSSEEKKPIKFKAPRPHPTFVREWNRLVPIVSAKHNFQKAHLSHLEILCDLYVEYENIRATLDVTGPTYTTDGGRNGRQIRHYPEVGQLNRTRADIATYSKLLGIFLLEKGDGKPDAPGKDEDWK